MTEFDKLFNSLPDDGWLREDEAKLLLRAANQTEGPILEVGCYYGKSTILLASLGRPVISVDPFSNFNTDDPSGDKIQAGFLENLRSRGIDNVSLHRERIEDWRCVPVEFAYLDGDHTYAGTVSQIQVAVNCKASHVCLHDYGGRGGKLQIKKAVDDSELVVVEIARALVHCRIP